MTDAPVVHIVDDDEAVRLSLSFLLETAGFRVETHHSAVAFLDRSGIPTQGCIVTDVRMPEMDGLTLQQKLVERGIALPVIVMTGHGDIPIAVQALKAGAVDFLEKPFDDELLISAVRTALERNQRDRGRQSETAVLSSRLVALTPREQEVLAALVKGDPNKTIAYDLGISARTVEVHRARVMEKMQARNLSDLVRMWLALRPEDDSRDQVHSARGP
ncbi:response regulator transcription factor [Mycobacterium sp. KBS0706]|uniref:response regulator FixJ n=1 Tax=Mycobacterium sp. KBS0706 TaxID=2578109 RepID=UPI00110F9E10|nr:response regulator FixJ [Mycobacterium sp. KBS0706]TSD85483.1 response regulator transcription factor [Mycobacterium sp. KBS0706]